MIKRSQTEINNIKEVARKTGLCYSAASKRYDQFISKKLTGAWLFRPIEKKHSINASKPKKRKAKAKTPVSATKITPRIRANNVVVIMGRQFKKTERGFFSASSNGWIKANPEKNLLRKLEARFA